MLNASGHPINWRSFGRTPTPPPWREPEPEPIEAEPIGNDMVTWTARVMWDLIRVEDPGNARGVTFKMRLHDVLSFEVTR